MTRQEIVAGARDLRLMPVLGEDMAPTMRRGDMVLVVPMNRCNGEGIFVTEWQGCVTIYRVQPIPGTEDVWVMSDNQKHGVMTMARAAFDDMVVGRVAFICNRVYAPDSTDAPV